MRKTVSDQDSSLCLFSVGDSCLGKLSVGVDNVVICPANCPVANASVLWCLNQTGAQIPPWYVCLESRSGEQGEIQGSPSSIIYVSETGELIVEQIPIEAVIHTTCTYVLGNDSICDPVSFEMTQKLGN